MKEDYEVISVGGMADHTRLTLCMFMLAVLSFNPFGIVMNRFTDPEADSGSGGASEVGRTILNVDGGFLDKF